MKEEEKKQDESVIRIPLPVIIPIVIVLAAVVFVLYKQEKIGSLLANSSEELEKAGENIAESQLPAQGNQDLERPLGLDPEFEAKFSPQFQSEPEPKSDPEPKPEPKPQPLPKPEQPPEEPKGPCENVACPEGYFCVEEDNKCVAKPLETSYCGDGTCQEKENREICAPDCAHIPMEGEGSISQGDVVVVYNNQLGGEWQMLKLKDTISCVSTIKDKFKIEMPEPAKTRLLVLTLLAGEDEKAYSYVNAYGIVHIQKLSNYQSIMEKIDYFREQINDKNACLSFHELIHIFLFQTPIPLWASEGLATYGDLEFNSDRISIQCRDSAWFGTDSQGGQLEMRYSDLSQPAGSNEEPSSYWYYTGYCFWSYLKQRYGDSAIIAILQELQRQRGETSLDFLKDIVSKVLKTDIIQITKPRFNVP
ncbi:MAG: hypothetical protein Q8N58_02505 [bacterium]|nr:hypothetical protein [bacterium]